MTVSINVACSVAPRAQLVADSDGKFPTPPATLNEMAKPIVTAPLTDDIICPVVAFSIGAQVGSAIPVTLQVKLNGTNYAQFFRLYAIIVSSASVPWTVNGDAGITVSYSVDSTTAKAGTVATSSAGAVVATITRASGASTVYLCAEIAGRVYVSSAITFA